MDTTIMIIGILAILGGLTWIGLQLKQRPSETDDTTARLSVELEQAKKEITTLTSDVKDLKKEVETERSKKDEYAGKNKQLFVEMTELKSDLKALAKERDDLQKKVTTFEQNDVRSRKDIADQLSRLETAKTAFEKEQQRVIREDEERLQREKEERDRLWNEHEKNVINLLTDICSREESKLDYYDNNNLPKGFDGSLKPDFLIGFLQQYIIFDAKTSKSSDVRTYIRDAVKKTAQKIKNKPEIYHTVFLVVPTHAIGSLKELTFYEQNYTFHVISPEALAPIIAVFKRMSEYEFADQFNPEDREKIVSAFASLGHHIKSRNAFDIILAKLGVKALEDIEALPADMAKDIAMKIDKTNVSIPTKAEIKKLGNKTTVEGEIDEMLDPKAKVSKRLIKETAKTYEIPMELEG